MQEGRIRICHVVTDYVATLVGVVIFNVLRFFVVPDIAIRYHGLQQFLPSHGVVLSMLLFPPFMLLVYYLTGYYIKVYNKSRITELVRTLVGVVIGSVAFFLVVLLNDVLPRRVFNYEILLMFGGVLFVCVYVTRVCLTTHYLHLQRRPGGSRNVVVVGDAADIARRIDRLRVVASQHGLLIRAVADISDNGHLPEIDGVVVTSMDDVEAMFDSRQLSCVLLVADTLSADRALSVINRLFSFGVPLYVSPDLKALIMGTVRYESVLAEPLVDISRCELSDSVVAIKRFTDIIISSVGLAVSLPIMAVLAVVIKMQSPGAVFYSQERIGYRKRPFRLYKLRSMCDHAEPDGHPMLSSSDDSRITPIGRVMRKYRLDELPNLWNVLKGDMSMVGPRPERRYYIDRIIERAPHYTLVHQVRPGLTSWGMVKYGYASDVDGMVERLRYDMLYLQNMSLSLDMRIIYYTLFTVLRGEGK